MSNPFEGKFKQFAANQSAKSAHSHSQAIVKKSGEVFEDKPFSEEYRGIYRVAGIGQSASQIITFTTTAALGVFALVHVVPLWWGIYLAVPLALLFAFGVERVKRSTLAIASKHLLKYKTFGAVGLVAILTLCVSIAAALYGAKELPGVVYAKPERATNPAAAAALTADIDRVQGDINRLQSGLKSGKNWTAENRTLPRLQKERAALVERRDAATGAAEWRADAQYTDALYDRAAKVEKMQAYSVGAAIVAELVFLLCTAFCLYYLFRHYAEQQAAQRPAQPIEQIPAKPGATVPDALAANQAAAFSKNGHASKAAATDSNGLPLNNARRPIGFAYANRITENVGANLRSCAHCNNPYTYGHARQKYCCEDCRVAAWETRTGATLQKKQKG